MRSDETYKHIHELLDLCIDANHEYPRVPLQGPKNNYLLVKPKSIVEGHGIAFFDVTGSASKFAHEKALTLHTITPDFWIVKP
jgi:hypothetical protein